MLLKKLKVRNFLSVKGECELPIDGRVTVLLGANDHGKSNLLRALEHLNFDTPVLQDEENWDAKGVRLDFVFQMAESEIKKLLEIRNKLDLAYSQALQEEIRERAALGDEPSDGEDETDNSEQGILRVVIPPSPTRIGTPLPLNTIAGASPSLRVGPGGVLAPTAAPPQLEDDDEDDASDDQPHSSEILDQLEFLRVITASPDITITRDGVNAELSMASRILKDLPDDVFSALSEMIPRVELFKAFSGELQDSVTADQIENSESEFLQGVFFYAGIDPLNCSELFHANDETERTLEIASKELDNELRRLWAQGVDLDLHFQLRHRGDSIEFVANDPAVKKRHARMSKRSAGVTQFFKLSMVLHARRRKNPANSYIYVFDEPGVFLHPKGQKDLLAVFEQLAEDTQIIYATHSLFMLNQNYPERHRLITKNKATTLVDSKPYRANWRYAVDALGVRLTANILFSPNILLVEGDSDPIYFFELFRVLNHTGAIDADANLLGIMSYGDLPNLRFLLQTFKAEDKERMISVVFDGDSQGKEYQKAVAALCKTHNVEMHALDTGHAIEDYCLYPDLFIRAVETTLRSSYEAVSKAVPNDLEEEIKESWQEFTTGRSRPAELKRKAKDLTEPHVETVKLNQASPATRPNGEDIQDQNAGQWFKNLSTEHVGSGGASKVALARNYAFVCRDNEIGHGLDNKRANNAKALLQKLIGSLNLPSMKAKKVIEG